MAKGLYARQDVADSAIAPELPQVAGFHVLPYGGPDAGGLMFVKSW